jgi:hypothetical protein
MQCYPPIDLGLQFAASFAVFIYRPPFCLRENMLLLPSSLNDFDPHPIDDEL